MRLIIILLIAGLAMCKTLRKPSLDEMLDMVVRDADFDEDGKLSLDEFRTILYNNYDVKDDSEEKEDEVEDPVFDTVKFWAQQYGGNTDTVRELFQHMDAMADGILSTMDVLYKTAQEETGDEFLISAEDFKTFVKSKYPLIVSTSEYIDL